MVKYIMFIDVLRQEEVAAFYDACQIHRENYKGNPKHCHPLTYFRESQYSYQSGPEMSPVYLSFPSYHVRYKVPPVLPATLGRTSPFPDLPERCLRGRFNKPACKLFIR